MVKRYSKFIPAVLLAVILLTDVGLSVGGSEYSSTFHYVSIVSIGLFMIYSLAASVRSGKFLKMINLELEKLGDGDLDAFQNVDKYGALKDVASSAKNVRDNIQKATDFATKIGEGEIDYQFEVVNQHDELGNSLKDMQVKLQSLKEEEDRRTWGVTGQAMFGEIFRDYMNDLEELNRQIVLNLVKYVDCNQGALYLIEGEEEKDKHLFMASCYAYDREKYDDVKINWGDGLIGQCALEGEHILLTEIPEDYIQITSGLGQSLPTCILICPLKLNDEIYGVVELASFVLLEEYRVQFVLDLCESLASTIASVQMSARTSKLLEDTRQSNDAMKQQEEEMTQVQYELNQKLEEIEKEKVKTQCIVDAINKTNASIEFDLEGNILGMNHMFASVIGYAEEDLIGKHEKILLPDGEMESPGYMMLWDSLKSGSFFSGEFRRVKKGGKDVWLNGTYNPIFDVDGKPYKVVKFAQFITEEKAKELEVSGKINALKNSVAMLELKPDLSLRTTNPKFLDFMKLKRREILKSKLGDFFEEDYRAGTEYKELEAKIKNAQICDQTLKMINKEGEEKYYHTTFSPIMNLEEELDSTMAIMIDVTSQVRQEQRLKEQLEAEQRKNNFVSDNEEETILVNQSIESIMAELSQGDFKIEDLIEKDTFPIIIINNEFKVGQVSNQYTVLTGMEDAIGHGVEDVFDISDPNSLEELHTSIATGAVAQNHFMLKKQDGSTQDVMILQTPIFAEDGSLHSCFILIPS